MAATGSSARPLKIWLFIAILLIVPVVAFTIVQLQGPHFEREAFSDLSVIAELKGSQIESWMAERYGDGVTIMDDQDFVEQVAALQRTDDSTIHTVLQREAINHLKSRLHAYGYNAVVLLDPEGQPLLALGEHSEIYDHTKAFLAAAFQSGQVQHCELMMEHGVSHLDFIVPLMTDVKDKQSAVGAVVLRINPNQFLFPFVQKWPGISRSGETLLVRRDGDSVLFLNEPHRQAGTALSLRVPLSTPDFPAAAAIHAARPGTIAGKDYQGIPVLTAYRPVVGTNWHIVAKLDRDEVSEPLWNMAFWISLIALTGTATLGVVLWLFWRQQQRMQSLVFLAEKEKSDRLLQQFFELPFIGMCITSPTTQRWEKFNDRLCEIFGYTRDELAGKNWLELTHPEDLETSISGVDRILRGESEGFAAEKRYIRKDGAVVLAATDIKCVRKEDGTVDYFCIMVQDITARKHAENTLAMNLARFRAVTKVPSYAIITADTEGNILEWNEGAERAFGYTRAEALGLPLTELMPQRFRDRHTNGINRARTGREVVGKTLEYVGLNKAGNEFPLEITLSEWSTAEGRFFTAIIRDITERKKVEDALRKLSQAVEQSPGSIVITDFDANIEYVNEGFIRATGYSIAEVLGKNPRVLKSGKTPLATYEDMWAHLTRGETWKGELINRRKDGSEYIELALISPVRQPDGSVTHYLAIKEDITSRKRAEAQLAEKLDELRRWHDVTMGREMRVLELKREVNELLTQAGQPPRYSSMELPGQMNGQNDSLI